MYIHISKDDEIHVPHKCPIIHLHTRTPHTHKHTHTRKRALHSNEHAHSQKSPIFYRNPVY